GERAHKAGNAGAHNSNGFHLFCPWPIGAFAQLRGAINEDTASGIGLVGFQSGVIRVKR
ncbi:MAG: hypothetical protein JWL86_5627, partial [Rhizobium sp.]|nr:hypothetical protein [Rhizobium sp.]